MRFFYPDLTAVGVLAVLLGISHGFWGLLLGVSQWILFLFNLWLATLPVEKKNEQLAVLLVRESQGHPVPVTWLRAHYGDLVAAN